jgi:hypothetical protein
MRDYSEMEATPWTDPTSRITYGRLNVIFNPGGPWRREK